VFEQHGNEGKLGMKFYTIQDLAKMLNLSETWFYERTRRKEIPFHRFGKYIRFTESDLRDIIAMAGSPAARNESPQVPEVA
jgi:excisionase family DNA binding protein